MREGVVVEDGHPGCPMPPWGEQQRIDRPYRRAAAEGERCCKCGIRMAERALFAVFDPVTRRVFCGWCW